MRESILGLALVLSLSATPLVAQDPPDCLEAPTAACLLGMVSALSDSVLADSSLRTEQVRRLPNIAGRLVAIGDLEGAVRTVSGLGTEVPLSNGGERMIDQTASRLRSFVRNELVGEDLAGVDLTPIRDLALALLDSAEVHRTGARAETVPGHVSEVLALTGFTDEATEALDRGLELIAGSLDRAYECWLGGGGPDCPRRAPNGTRARSLSDAAIALDLFERAAELAVLDPTGTAQVSLGRGYVAAGQFGRARRVAVTLEGGQADVVSNAILSARVRAGGLNGVLIFLARLPLSEVSGRSGSRESAARWLVMDLLGTGHLEEADKISFHLGPSPGSDGTRRQIAEQWLDRGDPDAAARIAESLGPGARTEVLVRVALSRARENRDVEARALLREVLESTDGDAPPLSGAELHARSALAFLELRDEDAAAAQVESAIASLDAIDSREPMDLWAISLSVVGVLLKLERRDRATELLESTVAVRTGEIGFSRMLSARLLTETGFTEDAQRIVREELATAELHALPPTERLNLYLTAADVLTPRTTPG